MGNKIPAGVLVVAQNLRTGNYEIYKIALALRQLAPRLLPLACFAAQACTSALWAATPACEAARVRASRWTPGEWTPRVAVFGGEPKNWASLVYDRLVTLWMTTPKFQPRRLATEWLHDPPWQELAVFRLAPRPLRFF